MPCLSGCKVSLLRPMVIHAVDIKEYLSTVEIEEYFDYNLSNPACRYNYGQIWPLRVFEKKGWRCICQL